MSSDNKLVNSIVDMFREVNSDLSNFVGKEVGKDPKKVLAAIEKFWGEYEGPEKVSASTKKVVSPKVAAFTKTTLVMKYSDKSCVVFIPSDNKNDIEALSSKFTDLKFENGKGKLLSYNPRLAFGPGWVLKDPSMVSTIEKVMKKAGVEYDTVDRDKVEASQKASKNDSKKESDTKKGGKKAEVVSDSEDDSSSESSVPPTKKDDKKDDSSTKKDDKKGKKDDSSTKKDGKKDDKKGKKDDSSTKSGKASKKGDDASDKSSSKPSAKKGDDKIAKENEWKNFVLGGFVYDQLKVGVKGKPIAVPIGTQDTNAKSSAIGLASVIPLTDAEKKAFGDKPYLNDRTMALLEKSDKATWEKYNKFLKSGSKGKKQAAAEASDTEEMSEASDSGSSDSDSNASGSSSD